MSLVFPVYIIRTILEKCVQKKNLLMNIQYFNS